MKIGIQVISLSNIGKNTIYIMEEALERECSVFVYEVSRMHLEYSTVCCAAKEVLSVEEGILELHEEERNLNLNTLDLILMRNDPPVDMRYITATYMLERVKSLVVNDPIAVRNFPEKLIPYTEYMPPTLVSEDMQEIERFIRRYNTVVIKPLYEFCGNNIQKIHNFETDQENKIKQLIVSTSAPIIVQEFQEAVLEQGTKRITILDGKLLGCFTRKNDHSFLTNSIQGGQVISTKLNIQEEEISYKIAEDLKERGITFAGIDMVAGKITEINVTSIAGIKELNELYYFNSAAKCLDTLEEMVCTYKDRH